ncbi:MAG: RDD family protein [Candidatus Melainabacteria bacterium]|nr:RDD family protein [Candidatus Melainabacteria bacterium]
MKSFGNRAGGPEKQPGKPVGKPPQGQRAYNRAYLNEDYQQDDNQYPAQLPNQQGMQGHEQWQDSEGEEAPAVRIEPGKRAGALLIDFVCAYFIGVMISVPVTFIPFMNQFFDPKLIMPVIVLFKDALFNGRGFGKNLMGLQVVDARTGRPCTTAQSFKRNIILVAPYIALLLVQIILNLLQLVNLPVPWWQQAHKMVHDSITGLINIVGMIYVAVVLPMECYRAWRRPDSLRKGDEFAGTMVVDSAMDFSNPLPR